MTLRPLFALVLALGGLATFPDVYPAGLRALPGYLIDEPGVHELGPAELAASPGAFPFPQGERLVYLVRYFGVEVGPATIEVARFLEWNGRRYVHLVATARTNEFWTRIYRVDDRTEAWVGLDDGRVARTRTRTLHGSGESREEVGFDWDTHFVHVRKVRVHKRTIRDVAFDFGPFVHDVFDAFYALRRVPFREGGEIELPVYASRKVHGFRVRTGRHQNVLAAAFGPAPVETIELQPCDTVDGVPRDAGSGRVYVLAAPGQVPVRLDGWFRVSDALHIGGVSAELVAWERGRADWPAAKSPPWTAPPLAPASVEGRPQWDPPPPVLAARARTGIEPYERKLPLE